MVLVLPSMEPTTTTTLFIFTARVAPKRGTTVGLSLDHHIALYRVHHAHVQPFPPAPTKAQPIPPDEPTPNTAATRSSPRRGRWCRSMRNALPMPHIPPDTMACPLSPLSSPPRPVGRPGPHGCRSSLSCRAASHRPAALLLLLHACSTALSSPILFSPFSARLNQTRQRNRKKYSEPRSHHSHPAQSIPSPHPTADVVSRETPTRTPFNLIFRHISRTLNNK